MIQRSEKKRLSAFQIDFRTWLGPVTGTLTIDKVDGKERLFAVDEEGNMSLAYLNGPLPLLKTLKFLLQGEEEVVDVSAEDLESLEVPVDYEKIAEMIDEANNPESRERLAFKTAANQVDGIIEDSFGLIIESEEVNETSMRHLQTGAVVGVAVLLVMVCSLTAFFYLPVIRTPYQAGGLGCNPQNTIGCPACNYWDSFSAWLFGIGYHSVDRCIFPHQ